MSVLDWTYVKNKIEGMLHASVFVGRAVDRASVPTYTANEGVSPSVDKNSGAILVYDLSAGGGATQYVEDEVSAGGENGPVTLGVRRDADTSPVSASGDFHTNIYDNAGALKVNVKTTIPSDAATDDMTIYGQLNDVSPAVPSEGGLAALRITRERGLHVMVSDIYLALKSLLNVISRPLWVDSASSRANVNIRNTAGTADTLTTVTTVTTVTTAADVTRLNNIGPSATIQASALYVQAYDISRSNWQANVRLRIN